MIYPAIYPSIGTPLLALAYIPNSILSHKQKDYVSTSEELTIFASLQLKYQFYVDAYARLSRRERLL